MVSLVKHLHGFVSDVRLTEAEFREATSILNQLVSSPTILTTSPCLMAGSLGISSLICLLNNGNQGQTETSQNLWGHSGGQRAARAQCGTLIRSDTPGDPLFVSGTVIDQQALPLAGAEVDVWHASPSPVRESGFCTGGDEPARQVYD